jgi:hypothetical protein
MYNKNIGDNKNNPHYFSTFSRDNHEIGSVPHETARKHERTVELEE